MRLGGGRARVWFVGVMRPLRAQLTVAMPTVLMTGKEPGQPPRPFHLFSLRVISCPVSKNDNARGAPAE